MQSPRRLDCIECSYSWLAREICSVLPPYSCSLTPGISLLEFLDYLTRAGESSCFELGEHQLVIDDDIKGAVTSWNQLCFYTEGLAQFIRQTGGVRLVVSHCAVADLNVHSMPPIRAGRTALSGWNSGTVPKSRIDTLHL
jgi:hypothetical protein